MNEEERYLFELSGYLVLEQVLTPEEVAALNAGIDHHSDQLTPIDRSLAGDSQALTGSSRRLDLGGMLAWEQPWCEPFRQLLAHSRVKPYLDGILGEGYRLDHGPGLIAMDKGCEGGTLHGGGVERQDFSQTYMCKFGKIYCGLTVVEFMLADEGPGNGGLALIPGSHKTNFAMPQGLHLYEEYQEYVKEIDCRAGDAVIFSEATTHGTLKWQGDHQRRTLIYKYSPRFQANDPGYHQATFPAYVEDMTPEQRQLLDPPKG